MAENNRVVDARGRSCPEPVLMTKKALAQQSGRLQVLVDNYGIRPISTPEADLAQIMG